MNAQSLQCCFVADARMTLVVGCMLLVATVLSPLLWHLWIHAGSANANFYFAMSVVYGIPQVYTVCMFVTCTGLWFQAPLYN